MKQAFHLQDEKSHKFWTIHTEGSAYVVNYGKYGTTGHYSIKEFDSEEDCLKQANRQITIKKKKGYEEDPQYDFNKCLYLSESEYGLHFLTSHPYFSSHFKEDFYYDCGDEEAPFGSDEGSDTLYALENYIKKNCNVNIVDFPRDFVTKVWDLPYYPPDTLDEETIKKLIAVPSDGIPMSQYYIISDQVIIASAIGQIKIMGEVAERLRDLALRSLKRLAIVFRLEGYSESSLYQKTYEDLKSFQNKYQIVPSETCQKLIAYLDCPCEVFFGLLDDDNMVYAYESAEKEGQQKGFIPLMLVVGETLLETVTLHADESSDMDFDQVKVLAARKKTLEEASEIDGKAILDEQIKKLSAEEIKINKTRRSNGENLFYYRSYWSYETNLSKEVILAKIPVENPWELAAYVPMGGFNDCPSPAEQAAIMKYWYETYDAVPALVSKDTWEFHLAEPVMETDAAELALEHYVFCPDRIEQYRKAYTLSHLADSLMKSTKWYFWWD